MRQPAIFSPDELKKWSVTTTFDDIRWVCARPMAPTQFGLIHRVKMAWFVFTGKYDVLRWGANQ